MSRSEMQSCLARLYTDESFRKLSRYDPASTIDHYTLTADERDAILAIDRPMLELFGRSLVKKRKGRFANTFAAVFALNPTYANKLWERYHQLHPAQPHRAEHEEIQDFGYFLEESLRFNDLWPPYAADIARYERLLFLTGLRRGDPNDEQPTMGDGEQGVVSARGRPVLAAGVEIATFRYDVVRIEEAIRSGEPPTEAEAADYAIVLKPKEDAERPRAFLVSQATMDALRLCDGKRTIDDVVAALEEQYSASGIRDDVVRLFERLVGVHVVRMVNDAAR